jgi:PAS domain S-box-containing protein
MQGWRRNMIGKREAVVALLCFAAALAILIVGPRMGWAGIGIAVGVAALVWAEGAHERARTEGARAQAMLDSALDAIIMIDRDGRVVEWNAAAERTFEIGRAQALGRPMAELIIPEPLRAAHREGLARYLRSGQPRILGRRVEMPAVRSDGSVFPCELTAVGVGPPGTPLFVGFVRDLTASKQAEEALRVSEERLRLIAESSSDVVYRFRVRPTSGFDYVSPAAARVMGWTPEQHYADPDLPYKVIYPPDRALLDTLVGKGTSGQAVDLRWVHPDGKVVTVEHRDTPVYGADGEIVAVHGIARDVTERRRDEREQRFLADVGGALASTLDAAQAAGLVTALVAGKLGDCCVIDLCGRDGNARVIRVAHADPAQAEVAAALQQVSLDEGPLGIVSEVLAGGRVVWQPDLPPGAPAALERPGQRAALLGRLAPRSAMAFPLEARGQLLGALVVFCSRARRSYDARDVRLGEEVARRTSLAVENAHLYRAAQQAIQARDDVLGIVAHDLRNPLGAALMAAGAIERNLTTSAGADSIRVAAGRIGRSIERANGLIEDLLDVSRIEAGALVVERSPVSAARLVADAAEAFAPLAAQASLRLETDVAADVPRVLADANRVQQVFSNLVGNAIKFTPAGGSVRLGASSAGGEVRFRVEDSGPGIPDGEIGHVFDRFWQARRGDRRGAGLGLPIAKGIIEVHGGRVWAESRPGGGATFTFTLPVLPAIEARRSASPP